MGYSPKGFKELDMADQAQRNTAAQEVKRKWEVVNIGKKQEILGNNLLNVAPTVTLGVGKSSLLHLKFF